MTDSESTHYLRLRWTACYMLFDDDRFSRGHTAFLNMADQIAEEIRQSGTDCDDVRPDMFNLLLAEKIENMIETFLQQSSSRRTEVEVAIAEKTVRLAKMYECHHLELSVKGEM